METINLSRRNTLKIAVSTALLALLPSCATNAGKPNLGPFIVDTKDVKDLNGFIAAIRKAGAGYLPHEVTLEDYYKAFAKAFVENGRKAVELGMQVPQWIVDKLPNKKVAYEKGDGHPTLITIVIWGIVFLVPLLRFFAIAIATIITLTKYIAEKLNESKI